MNCYGRTGHCPVNTSYDVTMFYYDGPLTSWTSMIAGGGPVGQSITVTFSPIVGSGFSGSGSTYTFTTRGGTDTVTIPGPKYTFTPLYNETYTGSFTITGTSATDPTDAASFNAVIILTGTGSGGMAPPTQLTPPRITTTAGLQLANVTTIAGTSSTTDASATITVYDNGNSIGSVTADASGNWTLSHTLVTGVHSLTAVATESGNYTTSATSGAVGITVDTGPVFSSTDSVAISNAAPFALTAVATDAASASINYSLVAAASHGSASINASSGVISYTMDSGYLGTDQFTIAATDGNAVSTQQVVHVLSDNAPTISATNPAPTFIVNLVQATSTIDSGLAVSDADAGNSAGGLGGGTLVAHITSGGDSAHDVLRVGDVGNISVNGATVSDSGTVIGTLSGGSGGTALSIALSSGVSNAQVSDLARAIQFSGGATASITDRSIAVTVTDALGLSASVSDTVHVLLGPTISQAAYDPASGLLTLTGQAFTTSASDFTLGGLTLTGEGSGNYLLGHGDAVSSASATSVVIQIAQANQPAVDALLDKIGTTAAINTSNHFYLAAAAGWDSNSTYSAPASSAHTVTVTISGSGTPTLTDSSPLIAANTTTNSLPVIIDDSTITVTDTPDLSGNGLWSGGDLAVAIGATNYDNAHDQLGIATTTDITTTGSGAGQTISYRGTLIGTVDATNTGLPGHSLSIKFSGGHVTDAAVAALVRAITFSDSGSTTAGDRSFNFVATDAYGRSSAALTAVVHVYVPPAISSTTYDPNTGLLTLTGTGFTVNNTDFTLSKLVITGEGSSTYTLGGNDAVSSATPTQVVIQIDAAHQPALDAILDKNGTKAAVDTGHTFNLAAAAGWDVSDVVTELASSNTINVSSSGTPTLSAVTPSIVYDTNIGSNPGTVIPTAVTVTDLAMVTAWNTGNLTASITGPVTDTGSDQLTIGSLGGISTSGSAVSYNSTQIGTIKTGAEGTPGKSLTVTLNANASNAAIAALVNAVQYSDANSTIIGNRTVSFTVTDAYGATSAAIANTVAVVLTPTITSTGQPSGGWVGGTVESSNASVNIANGFLLNTLVAGANGNLYQMTFATDGLGVIVYQYSGGAWAQLGPEIYFPHAPGGAGWNASAQIAYDGSGSAYVMLYSGEFNSTNPTINIWHWTGATPSWQQIAAPSFPSGNSASWNEHMSVSQGGLLYVSAYWQSNSSTNGAYVEAYNPVTSQWTQVAGQINGSQMGAGYPLAIANTREVLVFAAPNGTPYVWVKHSDWSQAFYRATYNASNSTYAAWTALGTGEYTSTTQIFFDSNSNPYFCNGSNIREWDGTSWINYATIPAAMPSATNATMAPDGSIYITYLTTDGAQYFVGKYDGTSWTTLGTAIPNSNINNGNLSLIADSSSNFYVGYSNPTNSYYPVVKTYAPAGVFYDPYTSNLTVTGAHFTTSAGDYTLSDLTLTGEGSGHYTLGNGDAVTSVSDTQLVIHIASTNQAAVDALLDTSGNAALVNTGNYFNLSAAAGWDHSGGIIAPAETINTVLVTSTGTPTLTNSNPVPPANTTSGGTAMVIDSSIITVTDQPDLSTAGMWAGGNLTVAIGATNKDSSHDELLVGTVGLISTSGSGAGQTISYNNMLIGTVDATNTGLPGHSLSIKFSGAAVTDAAVAALVNAIKFMDTGGTNTGDRTVTFIVTDAYGRASTALSDIVHVVSTPTISGVTYDPYSGALTLIGGAFVGNTGNITLGSLILSGEGGGSYTLGSGDTVASVSSTQVVITIVSANRNAVDALLNRNGTTALTNGHSFNLSAASSWDAGSGVNAPTNTITVTSSGTPTLTHSGTTTPTDTNVQSTAVVVDNGTITAGDTAYFSGTGLWSNGNLSVAISGAAADASHDQLSIGTLGGITTSGAVAGSTVSYNGTQIGVIASGATGTPGQALRINLSGANASSAAVQALVKAIQFSDSGSTSSIGDRTVTFTLTDAYARSATLADTVTVVGIPAISGVAYNPATGVLTLTGTNFTTTSSDYTLNGLTLSGETGITPSSYVLGQGGDSVTSASATSVVIQIDAANQATVDALLDKSGSTAAVSASSFNLAATAGWDSHGSVSAFVAASNTVTVTSTGTPTLTNNSPTIAADTTTGSIPKVIDSSTITVTDTPDLSGAGMWSGGNLTVAFGATNHDSSHDQLTVGTVGLITTAGSGAGQTVSYNGTVIGTVQAGSDGTPGQNLNIKLNGSSVSDAAVAALVGAIQFSDSGATTSGTRSLTFTVTDAYGRSSAPLSEKVYVTYDTPPVFVNGSATQAITSGRDMALTISSATLSVNDPDTNQTEIWSAATNPSHGTLSFSRSNAASGSNNIAGPIATYTPASNYVGSDNFTIQVSDGQGGIVSKTFNITVIAPVVSSIVRVGGAAATNSSSDPFTVTFNEAVTGLSAANFSLGGTDGTGTIGTPTSANGGLTWTVPVTGVSGNGTLGLNLVNTLSSVHDSLNVPLAAGFTDSASLYTIDTTAPVITGVTLDAATYAIGSTVTATIATDYDGHGNYFLSASTINGAALTVTGQSFNASTGTITATFTVTTTLADVLSGTVPVNLVVTDVATNASAAYTNGISGSVIDTHAPTAIALSNNVAPLYAGGTVGTLSTTDASTGVESFTYALSGTDAAKFQVVGNILEVATATTLNSGASYHINVQVTDAGGNSYTVNNLVLSGATGPGVTAGGSLSYNERSAAAVIDTSVLINDAPALGTMTGATVSISSGFTSGDVLGFAYQNGISGSYNASSGVLTLSGSASVADYQAALRSVTYADPTLNETGTSTRTITWAATDTVGTGTTATSSVTVAYVNAAPTLTATPATSSYYEAGTAVSLFSLTTAGTIEVGQHISQLVLTVTGLTDGSGEILRVDGSDVALTNGTSGTSSGGNAVGYAVAVSGTTATVTLSGSFTTTVADTVINALSYRDGSSNLVTGTRTITLASITDDGGISNSGVATTALNTAATVTVQPINHIPTLSATTSASLNYVEGAGATTLFSGTSVGLGGADVSQSIGKLVFTVSNVTDGAAEIVVVDGSNVTLTNNNAVTTSANNYAALVSLSGTTATVTITRSGNFSTAEANALVNALAYSDNTNDPTAATRVVTLTSLQDSGGTAQSGLDTATLSLASNVTVVPVNNAPTLTATPASTSVVTTSTASQLFTAASAAVVERAQSITGITVAITGLIDGAAEQFQIDGSWVSLTSAASGSAGAYRYVLGTISGGAATLTLSRIDSAAHWDSAITGLQYQNTNANATAGTRTFAITGFSDNGGTTNFGQDTSTYSATAMRASVTLVSDGFPQLTVPGAQTISDLVQHAVFGVALTDSTASTAVTATVSALNGVLSLTAQGAAQLTSVNGGRTVTVAGSLADVSNTLATLDYTSTLSKPGSDTITVAFDDNGVTLIGGPRTTSATIAVIPTPFITGPAIGGTVGTFTPAVSGTAEPGSTVRVYDGNTLVGTSIADSSGNWSVTTDVLGGGSHTLTTTETNSQNITSGASAAIPITVAGNALAAPTTSSISVLTGSNVKLLGGGGIPGASVEVLDNGILVGRAPVDAAGNWSYTTTLAAGSQSITIVQVDANGDVGPASEPLAMTAYSVAAPTITGPADGGTVSTDTPIVSGRADPGSTVNVYDGTTLVGTTTTSATGVWSMTTSALVNGVNRLSVTATNAQNVTSLVSGNATITVAGHPLAAPIYAGGSIISTTTVPLQGSGAIPGATIDVMDNGSLIGHTTVTVSGTWSLTMTMMPGGHQLTVQQIDASGNAGPISAVMALSVQLPRPTLPVSPVALPTIATPVAPVLTAPAAPVTVISAAVADYASFNQGSQGNRSPSSSYVTNGAGFQIALYSVPPANAISDGSLFVAKGISSLTNQTSLIAFTVPVDAFGHTEANAGIQLSAKLVDGRELPNWLSFDSTRATFVGQVPEGWHGVLSVIVTARDNAGHEVSTTFRIEVGGAEGATQDSGPAKPLLANRGDVIKQSQRHTNHPVGKLAFTQQLKMAARNAAIRFF